MKVIIAKPNRSAEVVEINGSLKSLQEIVGGYIETCYYHEDVCIICNEEGKIMGLPMNRAIRNEYGAVVDVICGNMIICSVGEEDFESLNEDQICKYKKLYNKPENKIVSEDPISHNYRII